MRGRFAPSPTGDLHVGNLRTAVAAWRAAREAGSEFLIRIEDLDEGRVRERFVGSQLDDLRAIGIDWDGEPVRQSNRTRLYAEALEVLEAQGRTFRCFCSRREIRDAASAAHGPPDRYPGTCRELSEGEADRRAAEGAQFAVRLRGGDEVTIRDRRTGPLADVVDDLVLVRADGVFAYNLAVVVDDAAQGIEEVVRGEDLLPSTPGQALLCRLLGLAEPAWTHVPLVFGHDGGRLSKRHGAVTLTELAEQGIAPERVRECLDRSLDG